MRAAILVALLSLSLLAGCAKVPPTHYYHLAPGDGVSAATEPPRVGVRPFSVDAPYDRDRLVYRKGRREAEVGFYAYHRWAAPLATMLPALVARELGGEPVQPGSRYERYLEGRVVTFEELDVDGLPHAVCELELRLVHADGETLWRGTVRGERAVRTTEVSEVVEGLRALLVEELRKQRSALSLVSRRQESNSIHDLIAGSSLGSRGEG